MQHKLERRNIHTFIIILFALPFSESQWLSELQDYLLDDANRTTNLFENALPGK